jgi:hypothetical protein
MFKSVLGHDYMSSIDPVVEDKVESYLNSMDIEEQYGENDETIVNKLSLEEYNKTTATIDVQQEEEEQAPPA